MILFLHMYIHVCVHTYVCVHAYVLVFISVFLLVEKLGATDSDFHHWHVLIIADLA